MVEHSTLNRQVEGSSPSGSTNFFLEFVNELIDTMVDLVSKNWNTHYSNLLQWIEYVNLSNYSRKKQVYGGLNDRGMPVV